jgi:hypothetical protein
MREPIVISRPSLANLEWRTPQGVLRRTLRCSAGHPVQTSGRTAYIAVVVTRPTWETGERRVPHAGAEHTGDAGVARVERSPGTRCEGAGQAGAFTGAYHTPVVVQ